MEHSWNGLCLYDQWVARSAAVVLVPGRAYVPANPVHERASGGRGELVRGVQAWNPVFFALNRRGFA